jgi:hypothetical protein
MTRHHGLLRFALPALWAFGAVLPFFLAGEARAQVSMLEASKRTFSVIGHEEDKGNQVLFMQINSVAKETANNQSYQLQAGSVYKIYAVGDDNRILDIDLEVLDEDGKRLGMDNDDQNVAIVRFENPKSQKITLRAWPGKLANGVNDGFFGLVVVRMR